MPGFHLTLQRPSAVTHACGGRFLAGDPTLVLARATVLELYRVAGGRLHLLCAQETFAPVRAVAALRRRDGETDALCVVAGGGTATVVVVVPSEPPRLERVAKCSLAGCAAPRAALGHCAGADAFGRAVLVGSQDAGLAALRLTWSAPLSCSVAASARLAERPGAAELLDLCAVDVGAGPAGRPLLFACLHATDRGGRELVLVDVDAASGAIVPRAALPADPSAALLRPAPGAGLAVGAEAVTLHRLPAGTALRCPVPRRRGARAGAPVLSASAFSQRLRAVLLLQTEGGDVHAAVARHQAGAADSLEVAYLETPRAAGRVALLPPGWLFVASAGGDHHLYHLNALPQEAQACRGVPSDGPQPTPPEFEPSAGPVPWHLRLVDVLPSVAPLVGCAPAAVATAGPAADGPRVYCLAGRGDGAALRELQPAVPVVQRLAAPYFKDELPEGVWVVRCGPAAGAADPHAAYVVFGYRDYTAVLRSEADELTTDDAAPFACDGRTLLAAALADGGLLQVTPGGVRHVARDGRVKNWQGTQLSLATANERQLVVVQGGQAKDMAYFELGEDGQWVDRATGSTAAEIACLALLPTPRSRGLAAFVAVSLYGDTGSVRILSVAHAQLREVRSFTLDGICMHMAVSAQATSADAASARLWLSITDDKAGPAAYRLESHLVDAETGAWSHRYERALAFAPPADAPPARRHVRLVPARVQGQAAVLALAERLWLCWTAPAFGALALPTVTDAAPLTLDHVAAIALQGCADCLVGTRGSELLLLEPQFQAPLNVTRSLRTPAPVGLAVHPARPLAAVLEADAHLIAGEGGSAQVRLVDLQQLAPLAVEALPDGLAPLSCALWSPTVLGEPETVVAVGAAFGWDPAARLARGAAFLLVYRLVAGATLTAAHSTPLDAPPRAVVPFAGSDGRLLLVAAGRALLLLEVGRQGCAERGRHRFEAADGDILALDALGSSIFVALTAGVVLVRYDEAANAFDVVAREGLPRAVTCVCATSADAAQVGDSWGNITLVAKAPHEAELEEQAVINVGSEVRTLCRSAFGAQASVLYAAACGRVGLLGELDDTACDAGLLQLLQLQLEAKHRPAAGRGHSWHRFGSQAAAVFDGDLAFVHNALSAAEQQTLVNELVLSSQRRGPVKGLPQCALDVGFLVEGVKARFF